MKELQWTSETPTEPGVYVWWHLDQFARRRYGVSQLLEGGTVVSVISFDGIPVNVTSEFRWLGPLPEDNLE